MKLSVIIPVYNEKDTIRELIRRVKRVNISKEIIIVDDCSVDGTKEILKGYNNDSVRIFFHPNNRGKGAAIRTALDFVTGDIVIIQDADLEYDPDEYHLLIEPIMKDSAKVVYGSRQLKKHKRSYLRYHFGGRFITWMTNLLYNAGITDEPTCYKVFSADVIKNIDLKSNGFEFCPEITAKVCKKGLKIFEVSISYVPRDIKHGKKIRWKDGIIALWVLIKYKFID